MAPVKINEKKERGGGGGGNKSKEDEVAFIPFGFVFLKTRIQNGIKATSSSCKGFAWSSTRFKN